MLVNVILIAMILVFCGLGIKSAVAHFQGKGSCCGGGSGEAVIQPEKLENPAQTKLITVQGMKCNNCAIRIQNALNSLEGVNAKVSHKKALATVKTTDAVTDEMLKEAVEKAGYTVSSIISK